MSRTIDEKVVQMQFDNRQFETNVRTSIGTLDKLKQSLRLDDAAKGLDGISNAARKFDISPMGNSVEAVKMKFSALEIMAITVLSNITNSAVNYGKRLVSAFTLEPIETGFQEYELKMGSVQTIMASTGESLETVNRYLEELNEYSDKTIYSFSDMTQNIGKFTNAGVKLEDAVKAIKGISNEAAVSGANANEASRAMYNFAQALSSGYVKLIDWKSIENANMATVEFKQQLIETAVACGTLTDNLDGTYTTLEKGTIISATQNFNDSLQEQWMTTEVLVNTLGKYADETTDIGKKAYAAAQDVKTFSMMMDTLKEAAQSGWAQTWELLVGDFEEAKTLFTELSERFGKMIDDSSKARNNFLKGALDSKWDQFTDQINEAGIATDKFEDQLKKTLIQHGVIIEEEIEKEGSLLKVLQKNSNAKKIIVETLQRVSKEQSKLSDSTKEITGELEKFQKIINQVINGEFGDGTERIEALNKAGYDGVAVQKLVDKIWKKNGETFKDTTITTEDLTDIIKDLSKEELENIGFTEEQAKKLKELADQAAITGTPINKLIDDIVTEKPSGRELLIDSLRNALDSLMNVLGTVKKAWNNVFTPMSSDKLYEIIETFHKFTERMVKATENTEGLQNALEGLFTVLKIVKDVITKIIGTGIKFGWKILKPIAKFILDVASAVGKLITKTYGLKTKLFKPFSSVFESISSTIEWFSDFLEKKLGAIGVFINDAVDAWNGKFVGTKIFETTGKFISGAVSIVIGALIKLHDCIKKINFSGIINNFKAIGNFFIELFDTFKNSEFGSSVIESIEKVFDKVYNFVKNFKLPKLNSEKFISSFSKFLDFMSQNNLSGIGGGIIGLFKYLKQQLSYKFEDFNNKVLLAFSNFYLKYGEAIKAGFKKFKDVLQAITEFVLGSKTIDIPTIAELAKKILNVAILFKTFKLLNNTVGIFDSLSGSLEAFAKRLKWKVIKEAFISLSILIGTLTGCLYLISKIPAKEAYRSLGILSSVLVLMGTIIGVLLFLASKLKLKDDLDMTAMTITIIGMSISLALLIATLKKIDGTQFNNLGRSLAIMFGVLLSMALSIRIIGKACQGATLRSAAAIITMLTATKMILSILKDYSKFDWSSVSDAIPKLVGMLLGLALILRIASGGLKQGANSSGLAFLMLSIAFSLKMILTVLKDLASMDSKDMRRSILGISAIFLGITFMLATINESDRGNVLEKGQKSVNNFKGLAVALLGVCASIWILGTMDTKKLLKGGMAVVVILGMFSLIMHSMGKAAGFKTSALIVMLVGFGLLMAEMATIIKILSATNWKNSIGAASALGLLLVTMAGVMLTLAKHTNKAKNIYKWIGALTVMGFVVGELATILWLIKDVNPLNAIEQVVALDILLIGMATCLRTLTKHTNKAKNIYKWIGALAVMGLVVGELATILWLIKDVDGKNAINQVLGVSALLITMTGCLAVCGLIGSMTKEAFKAIGALAVMGLVVGELAFILWLIKDVNGKNAISQVEAISKLLLTMSVCLGICTLVGLAAVPALAGIGVLAVFIVALAALVVSFGALANKFEWVEPAIKKGAEIMGILGEALGNFVGGIASGITSALPRIGEDLSEFMKNIKEFFDGLNNIKDNSVSKAIILANVIGSLSGSGWSNMFANILSIGRSLPNLGTDLSNFMKNGKGFFDGLVNFPIEAVNGMQSLADAIAILSNSGIKEGFTKVLFGEGSIESFSAQLLTFGEAISNFSKAVTGENAIDTDAITKAAEAGEKIANMAANLPPRERWYNSITDLGTFGKDLTSFALAITNFSSKVSSEGAINLEAIKTACIASNTIISMASNLPPRERWYNSISDLGTFGKDLPSFALAITYFSSKVSSEGAINLEAIKTACIASNTIISMAYNLPPRERWYNNVQGLGTFGKTLKKYGESFNNFCTKISEISNLDSISQVIDYTKALIELLSNISNVNFSGTLKFSLALSDLGNGLSGLSEFADAISSFSSKVSGEGAINLDAVKIACQAATRIANMASNLPPRERWYNNVQGLGTFGKDLSPFADAISSFSSKVSGDGSVDTEAVSNACKASSELLNMASNLPPRERWYNNVQGLGTFGETLEEYGEKFSNFCSKISKITNMNLVSDVISKTKTLIDILRSIVNADFSGTSNFVDALDDLGDGLKDFSKSIKDVNTSQFSTITNSIRVLIGSLSSIAEANFNGVGNFNSSLTTLGNGIKTFSMNISGIDSNKLYSIILNIRSLLSLLITISGSNFGEVNSFVTAINTLGTASVDKLVKSFTGASGKVISGINAMFNACVNAINSRKTIVSNAFIKIVTYALTGIRSKQSAFVQMGTILMEMFASGVSKGSSTAKNAMTSVCKSCINSISLYYGSFLSAGFSLAQGFSQGITTGTFMAATAARAMASAAFQAAKDELDINSPSKKFRKMAGCVPEGFAQGIDRLGGMVKKSSINMAQIALDSTQGAISQISRVVDGNMDISPTIRPVVDMDSISTERLQLFSNIDTMIAQPVDTWSQRILDAQSEINSSNNEVIRAIGNLRDDLKLMYDMVDAKDTNLYMDTKRVASSLAKPMNRELSILAKRGSN